MTEGGGRDVWLLRLDGDPQMRPRLAGRLLHVDVRTAQHVLDTLPRLIARGVSPEAARKLIQQIKSLGGIGHACPSDETPDFDAVLRSEERRLAAARTRRSGDLAADAARAVQGAAMLRWPDETEDAYVWESEEAPLPPWVPSPVRHSAARVAAVLAAAVSLSAGGATAYWVRHGDELTRVSAASWQTPDAGVIAGDDGADAGVAGEAAPELVIDGSVPSDEAETLAPPRP